jgi:hypothetical protein
MPNLHKLTYQINILQSSEKELAPKKHLFNSKINLENRGMDECSCLTGHNNQPICVPTPGGPAETPDWQH